MREPGTTLPDVLAANAWALQPPAPHERRDVLRGDAALLVDGLLVRVARGRGAIDVAVGEALASLAQGERVLRLGFSGLGDYARERLGIAASTAKAMARLARELRFRPLLAEAVRTGEVSTRKAQTVLSVALGEDEARWVERARSATVRELDAEVRSAREGDAAPEADDRWNLVSVHLTDSQREVVSVALDLAGKVLGANAPQWERLEALLQEALGQRPVQLREDEEPAVLQCAVTECLSLAKEALEQETKRWEVLGAAENVAAPRGDEGIDPFSIDAHLRELAAMRNEWDATLGHLALLVRSLGLWRDMGFANFDHYCAERLGLATRTVEQRVALERRLHSLPSLRLALNDGRVSYEQARVIARSATERTVDEWIARAEQTTCIDLMRAASSEAEAQMCRRNELRLELPDRVSALLTAACRAVRTSVGRWMTPGQCLELIAHHFIATWQHVARRKQTLSTRVRERDHGHCQVPGCSRAAVHAHHVILRSQCGGDELENLVGLCGAHHLRGVHAGYLRVEGEAPDRLTWELGVRPGIPPLIVVHARMPSATLH